MSTEWINSTVKRLRSAKVYLKTDYQLHVTQESPLSLPTRKTSTPLVRTSITLYVKDARIRSTAPGNY